MKFVIYTNKGFVRQHNEDAIFAAGSIVSGCNMSLPVILDNENQYNCFVVIDGMGGYKGGEKAARIIASSFMENFESLDLSMSESKNKISAILMSSVNNINKIAAEKPEFSSMGAALAGIALCSDGIIIFNCGDCRVYRQQGQHLEKLSHDHSIVQELYDIGYISEESMRTHPRKNTITAFISANPSDLNIFFREFPLLQNNKFLICSDGVWEALSIEKIEECLSINSLDTANKLVKKLSELQNKCRDNISFIMLEI